MNNPWSNRRKFLYITEALVILVVVVGLPLFYFLHKEPTCFDGRQNNNETGVDCGGICELLCSFEGIDPVVIWSRGFKVTPGVYSAMAYIQNPNINSEGFATYTFNLFDSKNMLIGTKQNTVVIPKNKVLAIFEPNITTGASVPARVTFELAENIIWRRDVVVQPELLVTQKVLSGETTFPRVDAVLENKSPETVERIEVAAIVYDDRGNAIAASRTFVDRLEKDQSARIAFTWPTPFDLNQNVGSVTGSTTGSATSSVIGLAMGPTVVEIIPRVIPVKW